MSVTLLILVVDDEPDVEVLFRQQFRHDLRVGRFTMEFALSGDTALQHIADAAGVSIILILSDINTAEGQGGSTRCPGYHDHRLRRSGDQAQGIGGRR
jgi:CheY-like chemotaxis protein